MGEDSVAMSKGRSGSDLCGRLSLICWLPLLTLVLAGGRVEFPGWMFMIIIWGIFLSPFAGTVLALIAATGRRWWLVLAAVWVAALVYGWWELSRHAFF